MEESLVVKKLMNVDMELRSLIAELRSKRPKPKISLEQLRKLFISEVKLDVDPTKLIRQMREKEYGL